MKKEFYSNGKLLITGEYVVLDGAKAFALPTKTGQNLTVKDGDQSLIFWKSFDADQSVWFEDSITFESVVNKEIFDASGNIKNTLVEILHEAYLLNPSFILNSNGYRVETHLTFPRFWGLGTSSTLINNIAQWTEVDAFELLKNSFGGSGYDIACAQNKLPILYQLVNGKSIVTPIVFEPSFTDSLFFVYLNKKQNSKTAIESYRNKEGKIGKTLLSINQVTNGIIIAKKLKDFMSALEKHESEMSVLLEMQTVKESLFPDFDGVIKSLGAWGGDFILAVSNENPTNYFKEKGYCIILKYKDMIL